MSYRYLSRETMVSLTSPLVHEDHADCQAIKADPMGRGLWEVLAGAHGRLLSTQCLHPSLARLSDIRDELARLRARHGQVVRGIYYTLQAQEELAADEVLVAGIQRLRAHLFPGNLMATRKSNRHLAGQAMMLRARLTAGDREILGQLGMLGGGTLSDALDEWFAIADAMAELENERSQGDDAATAADVAAARAHWIRTVQTFVAALRLRDDLPAAIAIIIDRIERVVREAGPSRRAASAEIVAEIPAESPANDDASTGDASTGELAANRAAPMESMRPGAPAAEGSVASRRAAAGKFIDPPALVRPPFTRLEH